MQDAEQQQTPQSPALRPSSRAGLFAIVAAGAVFFIVLSLFVWWVSTLPEKAAGRRSGTTGPAAVVPVADLAIADAADAAGAGNAAPGLPAGGLPDMPPLPPEAENEQPGLALTFSRPGGEPGAGDTRAARLVALYVPKGTAPTPFMDAGPFVATWDGQLNLKIRDEYTFLAQGRGKLTVTIGGKSVLEAAGEDFSQAKGEPVLLRKGKNPVVIRYEQPAEGDAHVRLLWQVKGEALPEPPGPQVWTHNAGAAAATRGQRVRDGRFLLAQLRCVKCHVTPEAAAVAPVVPAKPADAARAGPMPELAMDAPSLAETGARLNREWMAAWVNHPHALRRDAHMPRLFHDGKTDAKDGAAGAAGAKPEPIDPRAADVAAYLASLGGKPAANAPGAPADDKVQAGGVLFNTLNCTACHTAPDANPAKNDPNAPAPPAAADAGGNAAGAGNAAGQEAGDADVTLASVRVPLRYVKAKFTPAGLKQYLLDPHAHYVWNPMPNFRLSAEEADGLAAYLLANGAEKIESAGDIPAGDASKGKQLVESSGCLNCHAIGNDKSTLKTPSLAELSKAGWAKGLGKGGDFHAAAGPRYALTDAQRAAIVAFAATDRSSLRRDSPPEFAERQVTAMRCIGCHARDGKESLLATSLEQEQKDLGDKFPAPPPAGGEALAADQRPPVLTWAGEKLRPEWTASFIAGQVAYKPRPYLRARMPSFPARAGGIAAGLAEAHGYTPASTEYPKPDVAMAAVGQKLSGKTPNQAFQCVQCHAIADVPPFSPFEAPAINFTYARERLRKEYYHRWVHNPQRIDPNTKMPAYERDDGTTPLTDVYGGDARKQFEAIWQYLLEGREIKPPAE